MQVHSARSNAEHTAAAAQVKLDLFSDERIARCKLRNRVRRLTELCIECRDLGACAFGMDAKRMHETYCQPQVGNNFRRCSGCSCTLTDECPVDKARLADTLHAQLAICTAKRGLSLPLCLVRFDVI